MWFYIAIGVLGLLLAQKEKKGASGSGSGGTVLATGKLRVRLGDGVTVVNGKNRQPDPDGDPELEIVEVFDPAMVPPAWRTVRVSSAQIFDTPGAPSGGLA